MKLTYENDQQIIADAAQMLIQAHLSWSGSERNMPSNDRNAIGNAIYTACMEAHMTFDEWIESSQESRDLIDARANLLFKKAKLLADRKWEAAMTLLGIEQ